MRLNWTTLIALALVVSAACGPRSGTPMPPAPASGPAASTAAAAPAAPAAAPTELKVAVPTIDMNYMLPISVAEARGFFQQEGIAQQTVEMSTTASTTALLSKEVDIATHSGAMLAAAQGADARAVFFPYSSSTFQLSVDPKRIKQPRDLVGQALGIASVGNSQDVATRLMVKDLGVDPLSVNYLPMGGESARIAGMVSGQIVGSANNPDVAAELRRQGFTVIANSFKVMAIPWSGYGVNTAMLGERRPTLEAWMRAMIRGIQFVRQDPDTSADIVSQALQIDRDIARESVIALLEVMDPDDPGGATEAGLREWIRVQKEATPEMRDVTIDEVADLSPLRESQRALGIQCKNGYKC
ncbi:MAG TPA: ABC transporter substrate-binding protein [Chloroflexota bacterium]|nr:ABC transporter substrate-binding protein [Chloroflexota bacterium]